MKNLSDKRTKFILTSPCIQLCHFHTIEDALRKHNVQEREIHFVVNHIGHEDADIKRITAQFMECDKISLDEQLAKIK